MAEEAGKFLEGQAVKVELMINLFHTKLDNIVILRFTQDKTNFEHDAVVDGKFDSIIFALAILMHLVY